MASGTIQNQFLRLLCKAKMIIKFSADLFYKQNLSIISYCEEPFSFYFTKMTDRDRIKFSFYETAHVVVNN